ncbi:hypothetical protein GYMLUDRAFT_242307 [Collybiopsis luxurians FD-317 M1]|uniref:Electron transfer flavoprotein-ubiquinone oxidoreductase n=1 Tax=Collybiopsis luxurians FD-317 M1 TaxID=944289 RepID=A0A0D0C3G8_9AGAR|nr:hypothetical protein GYMLUDRAFT_242307 [Collybiopsis luxurians FD-317 M1]
MCSSNTSLPCSALTSHFSTDDETSPTFPLRPSSLTPTRIAYGARVLNEGSVQSLPLLHFSGGAFISDSAGVVNVAKIKGIHNSMVTGIFGGEGAWKVVKEEAGEDASASATDLSSYISAFTKSWVYSDLHEIRNLRRSFNPPFFTSRGLGLLCGVNAGGLLRH